jgi:hypothetical protein
MEVLEYGSMEECKKRVWKYWSMEECEKRVLEVLRNDENRTKK